MSLHYDQNIFQLPGDMLASLTLLGEANHQEQEASPDVHFVAGSCGLCNVALGSERDWRLHTRMDWHRFNLKRKVRGEKAVSELEFEKMLDSLNESISGSDSEAEVDDDVDALLRKSTFNEPEVEQESVKHQGSPFLWFSCPQLGDEAIGIYRCLFSPAELASPKAALQAKQAEAQKSSPRHVVLLMLGGGHFAGMVVSLVPTRHPPHLQILAHKAFHRYTTRRKQGGTQSAADGKDVASTAGASLRRYNEAALANEVRQLLHTWRSWIHNADKIFVRAIGPGRRIITGYPDAPLEWKDVRVTKFPFTTRRATQSELTRCFQQLTRAKNGKIDELFPRQEERKVESTKQLVKEKVKKEEKPIDHLPHLTSLIRRSRIPAFQAYLSEHHLSNELRLDNPTTPTLLHLAASLNQPTFITSLLPLCDPSIVAANGKTAFETARERRVRDTFCLMRGQLGEEKWDWAASRVPAPMTKEDVQRHQLEEEIERRKTEEAEQIRRVAEMEKLRRQAPPQSGPEKSMGNRHDTSGLGDDVKQKIERERRARAAEARMKR